MTDPRRWLDHPQELEELELRALTAARDALAPDTLKTEIFAALTARLPPPDSGNSGDLGGGPSGLGVEGAIGGSHGASGLASAVTAYSVASAVGVGAVVGALTMTVLTLIGVTDRPSPGRAALSTGEPIYSPRAESENAARRDKTSGNLQPSDVPRTDAARRAQPLEQRKDAVLLDASRSSLHSFDAKPAPSKTRVPDPRTPTLPSESQALPGSQASAAFPLAGSAAARDSHSMTDSLQQESRWVASAREQLRAGNITAALDHLERARMHYPNGTLIQERIALTIEALSRAGRYLEAERLAADFLRRYPNSPHAARVRSAVGRVR